MSMIKPNKPGCYEGKRNLLAVNSWLYQVKQYLDLVQVGSSGTILDDGTRISFASTFFTGTAASWWYTVVQSQKIPTTWPEFENALRTEFVPQDSLRRSRDKIRKLTQRNSVSAYLAEFRNVSLMIPNMTEDEKVDRFCVGLKPQIRLEVLKSGVQTLEQAARIALNVDSALYGAEMFSEGGQSRGNTSAEVPQPMDIGNLEQGTRRRPSGQRNKDLENNACFKCHKVGCRPWKHRRGSESGGSGRKSVNFNNAGVNANSSSEN